MTFTSAGMLTAISRGNYSYTVQLQGDIRNCFIIPWAADWKTMASSASRLLRALPLPTIFSVPPTPDWLNGTKLNFSFGKGIKEPSIYYQSISLYDIFAALPNGAELIKQYHVSPIWGGKPHAPTMVASI